MARTKKIIEPDEGKPLTWPKERLPETVIDDPDAELHEVFENFPAAERCIEVFRVNPQGGRPQYLESLMPPEFSFEYVAGRFGGGRYFARARTADGGRVRYPFEIEGEPILLRRREPVREPHADGGPTVRVDRTVESRESSGQDGTLADILRVMLAETRESEGKMLERMRLYKDIFAPSVALPPQAPIESLINVFQRGIELAGQDRAAGDNPWLFLVRELKEPLTKAIDAVNTAMSRQTVTVNPAPKAQVPAVPGKPAGSAVEPVVMEEQADMRGILKKCLPFLINGAKSGTDPGVYADWVLDQTPESAYPQLREWLMQPGCLDQLALLEPGIKFQEQWWIALREALLEYLNPQPDQDAASESASSSPTSPGTGEGAGH